MLNIKNASKVSERDYLYQLWLPILNSLFNINQNIVRIKIAETVLESSTEAKSSLYDSHSHVIGFKIDVRVLVDIDDEEFDLVCGEGCLQLAEDGKALSDKSKLLREGKEIEMTVRVIFDSSKENLQSLPWYIQFTGASCHFSIVNSTNQGYQVNVPQFSLSFPYSFLGVYGIKCLDNLFSFRYNVEQPALALKRSAKSNQEKLLLAKCNHRHISLSPDRQITATESTWFTPPRNDYTQSRIPHQTIYESGIESSGDDVDDDVDYKHHHQQSDTCGFIKTKNG